MIKTKPGAMYAVTTDGRLVEVGDIDQAPDHVVCRRVVDYAPAPLPPIARITNCAQCGECIAFNPAGPFPSLPKICMQCAHTMPLPIEKDLEQL